MAAPIRSPSPLWSVSTTINEEEIEFDWKTYPNEKPPEDGFYLTIDSNLQPNERILRYERGTWLTPEIAQIEVMAWKELPPSRPGTPDPYDALRESVQLPRESPAPPSR